jgi:hypothetical protein
MASKRSAKRLGDPQAFWGKFRTGDECLGIEMEPFIPALERAKNIFAFSPLVSGYEAKDTVECS